MRRWLIIFSGLAFAACGPAGGMEGYTPSDDDEYGDAYFPGTSGKADGVSLPYTPLAFDRACEPGERLTIAAVGDLLLHGRLQVQAFDRSDRYLSLWQGVRDLLSKADITYANLEGPAAAGVDSYGRAVSDPGPVFDNRVYTSYPMFNYHPSLLDDLIDSGVDVVSTANNHSLDRRALGVDRTIEALRERGLAFCGTRHRDEPDPRWYALTEANGFTLAWIACTYATNGIPDDHGQVLHCYQDTAFIEGLVGELADNPDIDAVLVTPHWGHEYHARPDSREVSLAHRLLDAGALAIIGSHPHVLQPWERYVTPDGRETFVIYSLGNFVSGQRQLARRSTLVLYLGLTRTKAGEVLVNGARFVPMHMNNTFGAFLTVEAIDRAGGPEDSRALTTRMFHPWNLQPSEEPVDTAVHCDPAWSPPPEAEPHFGWIGGACSEEGRDPDCGGAWCLPELPGGMCTEFCTAADPYCPDRTGRATTFCVDLGYEDRGVCTVQCTTDHDCRDGYLCEDVPRYGEGTVKRACVPAP